MRVFLSRLAAVALAVAFPAVVADAQERPSRLINVYLDCQDGGCDFDFLRQEITLVSWVRDRTVADVHVLVTRQETGAGGSQFNIAFLGLGRFAGMGDTLNYASGPTAVDDEQREGIAQVLRVGLLRFVARASGYDKITIKFAAPAEQGERPAVRDRWNFWVFEAGVSGSTDADKTDKFLSADGEFEARRVTDRWKTGLQINAEYEQSKFGLSEGGTFTNIRRNYDVEFEHVRSVRANFAVGVTGGIGTSTFSNQRRVIKLAPAIEYNIFPYSEASRRMLAFQYSVGMTHYVYEDTTIYLKLHEGVPAQQVLAELSARQPWGNVSIAASFRNQIMDASRRRATIGGEISLRVIRGLNLNVGGSMSSIHDQINLRLADLSDEEVLVRQSERGTSYRYDVNFGISYTFGSIFNNVVNPRFNLGDFF
jgi:hypothetical protein